MSYTVFPSHPSQPVETTVGPQAQTIKRYHVFIASPGDVNDERNAVRAFFKSYNVNSAESRGLHFEVIDWENYSSAGVGRPQELITEQTLGRYRETLALVVGIMAQRFGSHSGTEESGTEEEFEWAINRQAESGFPEVKWFFRDVEKITLETSDPEAGLAQWKKVGAFRTRLEGGKKVYSRSYKDLEGFRSLLENDIGRWLNSPERPWFKPNPLPVFASANPTQQVPESLSVQLDDQPEAVFQIALIDSHPGDYTAELTATFRNARVMETLRTRPERATSSYRRPTTDKGHVQWQQIKAAQDHIQGYIHGNPKFPALPGERDLQQFGGACSRLCFPARSGDSTTRRVRSRGVNGST